MLPRVESVAEYRRFSICEVNLGSATGWSFASGWFPFQASHWAWFMRDVEVAASAEKNIGGLDSQKVLL